MLTSATLAVMVKSRCVRKTCDRALMRGSMPLQAKADGLQLCQVPFELTGLNALEKVNCQLESANV